MGIVELNSRIFFLFCFAYFAYGIADTYGICKDLYDGSKCCVNKQQKGEFCIPCESGKHGLSCSVGPCPHGYYGYRCRYICYCSTDQYCERRAGCVYTKTNKTVLTRGTGVCMDAYRTMKCCTDFQQKDDFCRPCEVGTYGDNCSGGPCPYGSYGFGCLSKCNCSADQYCDRRIGCEYNATSEIEDETTGMNPTAEKFLFVILGVFLGVGLFLTILFVQRRIKYQRESRYNDTLFLPSVYDYPFYGREAELNITRAVNNYIVQNGEESRENPAGNRPENDYSETI